jgi:hypothetical protein
MSSGNDTIRKMRRNSKFLFVLGGAFILTSIIGLSMSGNEDISSVSKLDERKIEDSTSTGPATTIEPTVTTEMIPKEPEIPKPEKPKNDSLLFIISPTQAEVNNTLGGFTIDGSGKVSVIIRFSVPVDVSTAVVHKTIVFFFQGDKDTDVELIWSEDNRVLTLTTVKTFDQLRGNTTDQGFGLSISGLVGNNGHILDGDRNNEDGGQYTINFRIIG